MSVWLVERDVGGYEYVLFEIFATQKAAEAYRSTVAASWADDDDEITVREHVPLKAAPAAAIDPLMWGSRAERRPQDRE